ncbi:DUF4167 domain-containing protein [Rubrimonas cliftonensis]|uniref:DUF4167 domain-containing protein n=1 Tax=Rubrimonas cliftonensis TaxID=89524 RepID=UPI0015870B8F|nr:DUF4167 domain-containing protein [Rubrimonas cliftonensis]
MSCGEGALNARLDRVRRMRSKSQTQTDRAAALRGNPVRRGALWSLRLCEAGQRGLTPCAALSRGKGRQTVQMRPPQKNRNNRNKNNSRKPQGNVQNRVYESAGPEGKVRGTPQQIIEKYQILARDAQTSGDRVMAENFLQHAEHYVRLLGAAAPTADERRIQQQDRQRFDLDDGDEDDGAQRQQARHGGGDNGEQPRGHDAERNIDDRQHARNGEHQPRGEQHRNGDGRGEDGRHDQQRNDPPRRDQAARAERRDEHGGSDGAQHGGQAGTDHGAPSAGGLETIDPQAGEGGEDLGPVATPESVASEKPRRGRSPRRASTEVDAAQGETTAGREASVRAAEAAEVAEAADAPAEPRRRRRRAPKAADAPAADGSAADGPADAAPSAAEADAG